jgi:hypothetical protein
VIEKSPDSKDIESILATRRSNGNNDASKAYNILQIKQLMKNRESQINQIIKGHINIKK